MNSDTDFFGGVLKIALGIALGGFILWVCWERYATYQLERAARELQSASLEASSRLYAVEAARARKAHELEARVANDRAEFQRAATLKAEAWARFYHPSERCLNEASVECGNAHIRAQREFEQLWAEGRL